MMICNKTLSLKKLAVTVIAVVLVAGKATSANDMNAFVASAINTELQDGSAVGMAGTRLLLAQAEPVTIESNLTAVVEAAACEGSFVGNDLTLTFSGYLGTSANLLRDNSWIARVTGFDSYDDVNAPADASYVLRTRTAGVVTDTNCMIEREPEPPAAMCVGSFTGNELALTFSGNLGTSANLLRDNLWIARVTGFDSYDDVNAPADASYVLRTRTAGVVTDTNCMIEREPEPPAAMCVGSFTGNELALTFSGNLGTSANLLRDNLWIARVTGFDSYDDVNAPADAPYVLRTRTAGVVTDTMCVFDGGDSSVTISEFVASNDVSLTDHTGDNPDWIELHNSSNEPVDLTGWTITAGSDVHVFSGTVIGANEYLVIFASGNPERTIEGEVHVDFRLSASGESLILADQNGDATVPAWTSEYPAQTTDIGYGIDDNGFESFFNPPTPGAANVVSDSSVTISEFVASNDVSLTDHTGDNPDWIELHNSSNEPVDLTGWTITAGSDVHVFSGTVIGANEYLVIFASGNPERTIEGEVHVDFRLSASGESLILADQNGDATVPAWTSEYPAQTTDIGYGIDDNGFESFFNPPTPGAANNTEVGGFVEPVAFSLPHGFYRDDQSVVLSTTTPSATIHYTTDGSTPSASNGSSVPSGTSIDVNRTTVLRAVATRSGWESSPPETRSYLFAAEIASRSESTPTGWPDDNTINGMRTFYGMDPDLTTGERVSVELALTAIPSISITTDLDNLFNAETGIWSNPESRGGEWERPVSIELIDPTGAEPGFDINGGLRIKGGTSRSPENFKHSMRLVFSNDYGDGELNYPVHGTDGVDVFESLDLKTAQSWSWNTVSANAQGRGADADWLRDVWSRDTQGAMGHLHTRSKYVHAFLNGQYWGLYYTEERVANQYASQYLGGDEGDYDIIKEHFDVRDGTIDAWDSLSIIVEDRMLDDEEWVRFQDEINVVNLADYYLLSWVSGDSDSSPRFTGVFSNNWFAVRDRTGNGGGGKWHFVDKDSESALCTNANPERAPDWNPTPPWNLGGTLAPAWLLEAALTRPEFVQIFKDRVQLHMLTPGGALTVEQSIARLDNRRPSVDVAIDAEAARWGNTRTEPGFDRVDWELALQNVRNCFALRTDVMLDYLAEDGLLP